MFRANEFSGVSSNWSILFALFSEKSNDTILDVCESNVTNVRKIGTHKLYMLDKAQKANYWITVPTKGLQGTRNAKNFQRRFSNITN